MRVKVWVEKKFQPHSNINCNTLN